MWLKEESEYWPSDEMNSEVDINKDDILKHGSTREELASKLRRPIQHSYPLDV